MVVVEDDFEDRWPGASMLAASCFTNLWVLSAMLESKSNQWLNQEGYSSSAAFNVLTILEGSKNPLLPSEIAERLFVSRPTITGVLDSLERGGHIRRRTHPDDGRRQLVEISPQTRRRVVRSMRRLHQLETRLLGALTAKEQQWFVRMLAQLQAAVREIDPSRL